jgi:hypothetical protein
MGLSTASASRKVDNNSRALAAKIDIRRRVMAAVGKPARVFDAFAGEGQMYSGIWKDADTYVGCDVKYVPDGRLMFAADNKRVLRAIELSAFNIFDLDAYGSPFEQAIIIADRRRVAAGELLGLVMTEGSGISLKANIVSGAVQELARVKPGLTGVFRNRDALLERTLSGLAERFRCTIEHRWQADGKANAAVRYIGLVLKGKA